MRSLVLLAVLPFATGCLNEYGEYDLVEGGGDSGGGGGGGGGYEPPVLRTSEVTSGNCYRCPVAVGGSTLVKVKNGSATGVQVRQSSPSFELVVDPSAAGFTEYVLTATAPATTTLIASSLNFSELHEDIAAHAVDRVRLVAGDGGTHHPLGSEVVWHTSSKQAAIAIEAADGSRLVDISLELMAASSDAIELTAWDTLALPTAAGRHHVLVRAHAFGQRQFPFEVVADIDRVEYSVDGTLERVGDVAEICFYPLLGTRDVATPVEITLGSIGDLAQTGIASGSNCRRVVAKTAGVRQVGGTALGRTASLTFTIAP